MNTRKELGRIASVRIGMGGYQDAMLGIQFVLEGKGWGVHAPFLGTWATWREGCKWSVEDQTRHFGDALRELGRVLEKAKKEDAYRLVGTPIEAEFDGMTLKSWRVLEEVL